MDQLRRDFVKQAAGGAFGAATVGSTLLASAPGAYAAVSPTAASSGGIYDVRTYGAKGDGKAIDSPAINRAIDAASAGGGGTVHVPAGIYLCYSIRLKSNLSLYVEQGTTIIAGPVPPEGLSSGGFDPPEPAHPWQNYQDYGHNHWHNSLIWGEDLHDVAILGPGLIWGKGISIGLNKTDVPEDAGYASGYYPLPELPGVANKSIALKNCRNVTLRDFSILEGGEFGVLATAVDNLTIDNLKLDTARDGLNIDCCRNVRIANCSINCPYEDAISPKSSYSLGYPRMTENLTVENCFLTGAYQLGSLIDGTWKRWPTGSRVAHNARFKCGTESNAGFRNITVSNCVFEGSRGLGLLSYDGATVEDITFNGITLRDCANAPILLRIDKRMRGPEGVPVGTIRRVSIRNIVSSNGDSRFGGGGVISGIPGHPIEDLHISDVFVEHRGGGTAEMAAFVQPDYGQDPTKYGNNPAHGFFVRHANNVEFSNVEIASQKPDARPAFWMNDVDGADFFRIKTPKNSAAFALHNVKDFRVMASRSLKDATIESTEQTHL